MEESVDLSQDGVRIERIQPNVAIYKSQSLGHIHGL